MSALAGCLRVGAAPYQFDPDAAAFLTAIGLSSDTAVYYAGTVYERTGKQLRRALDRRVKRLKAAGLWQKLRADYPFLGGTAARHARNLLSPADTDAAGRLSYGGSGASHGPLGFSGNRTAWADAHITPASLPPANVALSQYVTAQGVDALEISLGASDAGITHGLYLLPSYANANYSRLNNEDAGVRSSGQPTGSLLAARTTTLDCAFYGNGATLGFDQVAGGQPCAYSLYLGALNNGGTADYLANHYLGSAQLWQVAPSDVDYQLFYDLEREYQTALGRQV